MQSIKTKQEVEEEDQVYQSADEEPEYTGPITRSRARAQVNALAKVKVLTRNHVGDKMSPQASSPHGDNW